MLTRVFQPAFAIRQSSKPLNHNKKTVVKVTHPKHVPMPVPRNAKQATYLELLQTHQDEGPHIIIASGSAGTGKTALATHVGVHKLKNNQVKRIIITRPAVCADEEHGFLPGSLDQKMEPWVRPVFDVLHEHFSPEHVKHLLASKTVELCPLAFMRGRTFEKAWIICDEAQNTTKSQSLLVMTRIGTGSKLVITGDPMQFDRGFEVNGLADVIDRVERLHAIDENAANGIAIVHFEQVDVVRHPIISTVLDMYK